MELYEAATASGKKIVVGIEADRTSRRGVVRRINEILGANIVCSAIYKGTYVAE